MNYGASNYFKLNYFDCTCIPESYILVMKNQILFTYSVDHKY